MNNEQVIAVQEVNEVEVVDVRPHVTAYMGMYVTVPAASRLCGESVETINARIEAGQMTTRNNDGDVTVKIGSLFYPVTTVAKYYGVTVETVIGNILNNADVTSIDEYADIDVDRIQFEAAHHYFSDLEKVTEYLPVNEAAKRIGMSARYIYDEIKEYAICEFKLPGYLTHVGVRNNKLVGDGRFDC